MRRFDKNDFVKVGGTHEKDVARSDIDRYAIYDIFGYSVLIDGQFPQNVIMGRVWRGVLLGDSIAIRPNEHGFAVFHIFTYQ